MLSLSNVECHSNLLKTQSTGPDGRNVITMLNKLKRIIGITQTNSFKSHPYVLYFHAALAGHLYRGITI
jgi:hypothetical protein